MASDQVAAGNKTGGLVGLICSITDIFTKIPSDIIALLARFCIGMVFWLSGQTKVDGWSLKDTTFLLFENEYNLPLIPHVPAAYMATIAEHVLPILLWLGLATRFSALGLLIMTLVIQIFVYPNAYVLHGTWAVALLFLIKYGPGTFSIDYLLGDRK